MNILFCYYYHQYCKGIVLAVKARKTKYMEVERHRGMMANKHIRIGKSENL